MKKIVLFFSLLLFLQTAWAQWAIDKRLTNNSFGSWISLNNARCIAVNGDTVHVVFNDCRDGAWEIYYKRSDDAGKNWREDTRLTYANVYADDPCISVSGSIVHLVWCDRRDGNYEIYYKRSTDSGKNWDNDVRLTQAPEYSDCPSVAASGSFVHVVWTDFRTSNYEIYYKRSSDGGMNWGEDTRLTFASGISQYSAIAINGSFIHLLWEDSRDGNYEEYYKRSSDNGTSWEPDVRLTISSGSSWYSSIAATGNRVHAVWQEYKDGNYEIYYKRSANNGTDWQLDTRLTSSFGDSQCPSVAANSSDVHIVWFEDIAGNTELIYRHSPDEGDTWEEQTRLTYAEGTSENPSIALSDSNVHIVWFDHRDDNDEIYYKHNLTGNIIIGTGNEWVNDIIEPVRIFPNPASGQVACVLNSSYFPITDFKLKVGEVVFINLLGQVILHESIKNTRINIDISSLQTGIYYMVFLNNCQLQYSTKLIKY